jgi:uncharacterized protein (DUF1330 family)
MTDNKTTLVATATPNPSEQESVQAYQKGAMPLLMEAGGQLVKRLKVQSAITGKPPYGVVLVMEFPDREKLENMFASEAYAALLPARDKGFASVDICLASEM